jgi:hypothetical protein
MQLGFFVLVHLRTFFVFGEPCPKMGFAWSASFMMTLTVLNNFFVCLSLRFFSHGERCAALSY